MLLSDFNEDDDVVSQFQADDIAKTLTLEEILLIAMYVDTFGVVTDNHQSYSN